MIPILLFVLTTGLYLQTFSTSIYGADSGDLVSAAVVGGVAHPPGYPLYLMLSRLFLLLPGLTPAGKINLFSLLTSSAVIALVYLLVNKLTKDKLVAIISSLTLALTIPFWLYSTVAEVFPLNTLFVVLLLLLAIIITERTKRTKSLPAFSLYLFSFVVGLSLTHHHTILLIFPSLAILLGPVRKYLTKRTIVLSFLFLVLGLLPYIYAPIAALSNPAINWDDPKTFSGFFRLVTRADYGTITPVMDLYGSGMERLSQLLWFAGFLRADFTWIGIVIALLGLVYLYQFNKNWFWAFLVGFLISGPLFSIYADYPTTSPFLLGVIERFVFVPYIFFIVFFAFGISWIGPAILKQVSRVSVTSYFKEKKELTLFGIKLMFIILPLYLLIGNFGIVNLKGVTTGDKLGLDVLATAGTNSIIILQDDTVSFNTQYVYYGLKTRPDLLIILPGQMRHQHYRDYLKRAYPHLEVPEKLDLENKEIAYLNARYTEELISRNLGKFAIYTYGAGFPVSDWEWVPTGILIKLFPKDQKPNLAQYRKLSEEIWQRYQFENSDYEVKYKQLIIEHIIGVYKFGHLNAAGYFAKLEDYNSALAEIDKAIEIDENSVEAWFEKGRIGLISNNCEMAGNAFLRAQDIEEKNIKALVGLKNYYQDCVKDESKVKEIEQQLEKLTPKGSNIPLEKF